LSLEAHYSTVGVNRRRGGAGGTVLPRRRSRANLVAACFTRNTSSLAAGFCYATPFSEVALSEDRTSSHPHSILEVMRNSGGEFVQVKTL
jgi:hypothetical protein